MADDTLSILSEWNPSLTVDQLGGKLMKTREHLKKAIARIIELETKETQHEERINQLELKLTLVISKLDQLGEKDSEDEDLDSLDDKWKTAGKDDSQPEGPKPPGSPSTKVSKSKTVDFDVQGNLGGRSGGLLNSGHDDDLDSENQHGIRARVLDPSKVVHYRFDGKDKDYLQWSTLMVNYLEGFGLWSYVSGERPRPPAPTESEFNLRGVDENNYARYVH